MADPVSIPVPPVTLPTREELQKFGGRALPDAFNAFKSALTKNPGQKEGKLTAIDQIYKLAGKDGFEENQYQYLISLLAYVNSSIINTFNTSHYEYTDTSYLASSRAAREKLGEPKTLKKNKVYGVILKVEIRNGNKIIYIDVPPWNTKLIEHPDVLAPLTDEKLKDYEDLIFFPETSIFTAAQPYRIAVVEVPENFPNHVWTNPEDAVYKELYDSHPIIKPMTSGPKAAGPSFDAPLALPPGGRGTVQVLGANKSITNAYDSIIYQAASDTSVDKNWIRAIILIESDFKPGARSKKGAVGLAQFMQDTFNSVINNNKQFWENKFNSGPYRREDATQNIYACALLLKELKNRDDYKTYGDTEDKLQRVVAADYNGSPKQAQNLMNGRELAPETKDYIERFVDAIKVVRNVQFNPSASSPAPTETQAVPSASPPSSPSGTTGSSKSLAVNQPKMLLVDFDVDIVDNVNSIYKRGSSKIKIREDIVPELKQIKNILNSYSIPFTCNALNIDLNNKNLSDLARVGLEIQLNINAGLKHDNFIDDDTFFVSPDLNNKVRVYAQVRRNMQYIDQKYIPIQKKINIYSIRDSYNKKAPEIKQVFKSVIDITQIFEDYGFLNKKPDAQFFIKSDNTKCNWNIFYKPRKIKIGYSYKELLETVYYNNNEQIWDFADKKWDGNKFI